MSFQTPPFGSETPGARLYGHEILDSCGNPTVEVGAPARGERVAKYNQPMRIERYLGSAATCAGKYCYVRPIGF